MSKKFLFITGILLAVFCFAVILLKGDTFVYSVDAGGNTADDYIVTVENGNVEITDKLVKDGKLTVTVKSVDKGNDYVAIKDSGDVSYLLVLYVHRFGIITENHFLGRCSGDFVIPVCVLIYLAVILLYLIMKYRSGRKLGIYRYENVSNLALTVFLLLAFIVQLIELSFGSYNGFIGTMRDVLNSAGSFTFVLLPPAVIISLLVALSNIDLMRKEGVNYRNMLGLFLGAVLCVGSFFPEILDYILRYKTNINIYKETAPAVHIEKAVECIVTTVIAYIECVLLGTIVEAVRAARHTPAFDKDYIIINGCKIKKDGTLTNLLKGRADKAVAFAKMQKEKTGKDIVFVPSGGQGPDEVMPEAQAIKNYLLGAGIDENSIITEDKSTDTAENFRYSAALIREREGNGNAKIAFATTNYHVFRSGLIASQQGINAEGTGSRTRAYFWINAFIREFIATLVSQKKKHIKTLSMLSVLIVFTVAIIFISDTI